MNFTNPLDIVKNDSGATAIEYGLIAGLVSVVCITALQLVGGSLTELFTKVNTDLQNAINPPAA